MPERKVFGDPLRGGLPILRIKRPDSTDCSMRWPLVDPPPCNSRLQELVNCWPHPARVAGWHGAAGLKIRRSAHGLCVPDDALHLTNVSAHSERGVAVHGIQVRLSYCLDVQILTRFRGLSLQVYHPTSFALKREDQPATVNSR